MYGAVDPIYMIMLIKVLGPDYIVWDKAATIRFIRPGRSTLYARFLLEEHEIVTIRQELSRQPKLDQIYHVDLMDQNGIVHASIEKTIYIRIKEDRSTEK